MANDKLMLVSKGVHAYVIGKKIIPKEPFGDCLKRLLNEYCVLKGEPEIVEPVIEAEVPEEDLPTTEAKDEVEGNTTEEPSVRSDEVDQEGLATLNQVE